MILPRVQFELWKQRLATRSGQIELIILIGYLIWLAIALGRLAALKPLWYDELFTLHLARVASPRELLEHLAAGVDLNPPLLYWLTRLSILTFGEAAWALRLPALAGMILGLCCFFSFLRRRWPGPVALVAVAASVASIKVWTYFLEARPYGLAFGFAGLAVLCWQRASEPNASRWWRIGLALAAILGVSTHYYFVTVLAALGVAEVARWIVNRRFEYKLMLAMAWGGIALAAWYPLWHVAPRDYAAGFWAKAEFHRAAVESTLAAFLEPSLTLPVLAVVIVAVLAGTFRRSVPFAWETTPMYEVVLLAALAVTPVLGQWIGATLTGGFFFRYTIPAAIGCGALFAIMLHRASNGSRLAMILIFLTFTGFGLPYSSRPFKLFYRHDGNATTELITFLKMHANGQPVVMESGFDFGRVWHYGSEAQPVFLADPERALLLNKVDTTERALQKLKRVTDVPVRTVDELMAELKAGKEIYYYGPATAWGYNDLISRNVRFEVVAERPGGKLFRIR